MSTPLSAFAIAVGNLLNPANGGYTAYTYETIGKGPDTQPIVDLAASTPTMYADCSEWVNYALNTVAPVHQAVAASARLIPFFNPGWVDADGTMVDIRESLQPWARAGVLAHFFGTMATGTNGFAAVADFATLRAGDMIAYALGIYTDPVDPHSGTDPTLVATYDTGHTMVVIGAPVEVPRADWGTAADGLAANVAHVHAVPVVDSSGLRHFSDIATPVPFAEPQADSRNYAPVVAHPPNLPAGIPQSSLWPGGLGFGTMWFATDANGDPVQFRFDVTDAWYPNTLASVPHGNAAVMIAAARLTGTIDLSGSLLDADNRLVLTAFADAAQTLDGIVYNTQAETLTGSGGLLVEGGGLVQLGAGNSFTGGIALADATVSLAGAAAAGRGVVTFVDGFASTLQLQNAAAVPAATLLSFSAGDAIDLAFAPFTTGDHALWTQAGGAGGTLAIVSAGGVPITTLSLNGIYSNGQFILGRDADGSSVVTTTATSPVTVHDDAYVVLQGGSLSIAATTGILANDENVSSAALVGNVTHGALQLSASGGFSYTPTAGFTGIDSFAYDADNDGAADAQVQIHVIPVSTGAATTLDLLALDARQLVAADYVFLGRGPDAAGFDFWIGQLDAGRGTQGTAVLLGNIANAFAASSEARELYPFLADPRGAGPAQIGAFLDSVYDTLFGRSSDAAGLAYWMGRMQQSLASGGFVGSVLVDMMAGAQDSAAGRDLTTLASRIAVGLEYVGDQALYGSPWSAASDAADAAALLQNVEASPQSVLAGIAQAQNLVLGDLA